MSELSKRILVDEILEQSHPVPVEDVILKDPLSLHISGTASLGILIIFLVGIILICLGFIALYIGNIHSEVTNRPIYIVRKKKNIDKK